MLDKALVCKEHYQGYGPTQELLLGMLILLIEMCLDTLPVLELVHVERSRCMLIVLVALLTFYPLASMAWEAMGLLLPIPSQMKRESCPNYLQDVIRHHYHHQIQIPSLF